MFAALTISRWIEDTTGWSIRKFVRTARRYRTIEIQAGTHTITAADPLPTTFATPWTASTTASVRTDVKRPCQVVHGVELVCPVLVLSRPGFLPAGIASPAR